MPKLLSSDANTEVLRQSAIASYKAKRTELLELKSSGEISPQAYSRRRTRLDSRHQRAMRRILRRTAPKEWYESAEKGVSSVKEQLASYRVKSAERVLESYAEGDFDKETRDELLGQLEEQHIEQLAEIEQGKFDVSPYSLIYTRAFTRERSDKELDAYAMEYLNSPAYKREKMLLEQSYRTEVEGKTTDVLSQAGGRPVYFEAESDSFYWHEQDLSIKDQREFDRTLEQYQDLTGYGPGKEGTIGHKIGTSPIALAISGKIKEGVWAGQRLAGSIDLNVNKILTPWDEYAKEQGKLALDFKSHAYDLGIKTEEGKEALQWGWEHYRRGASAALVSSSFRGLSYVPQVWRILPDTARAVVSTVPKVAKVAFAQFPGHAASAMIGGAVAAGQEKDPYYLTRIGGSMFGAYAGAVTLGEVYARGKKALFDYEMSKYTEADWLPYEQEFKYPTQEVKSPIVEKLKPHEVQVSVGDRASSWFESKRVPGGKWPKDGMGYRRTGEGLVQEYVTPETAFKEVWYKYVKEPSPYSIPVTTPGLRTGFGASNLAITPSSPLLGTAFGLMGVSETLKRESKEKRHIAFDTSVKAVVGPDLRTEFENLIKVDVTSKVRDDVGLKLDVALFQDQIHKQRLRDKSKTDLIVGQTLFEFPITTQIQETRQRQRIDTPLIFDFGFPESPIRPQYPYWGKPRRKKGRRRRSRDRFGWGSKITPIADPLDILGLSTRRKKK